MDGSAGSLLELTLRGILQQISPTEEDWNLRRRIINNVRLVIERLETVEDFRGATVEPYGSFVSDLFTKWGDLDISIELPNGFYISCTPKRNKQRLLGLLKDAFIHGGEQVRKLRFYPLARIPILKFETRYNVSCDISVNNLSGQMKSKMLYWIGMIDPRFRDMVLLVKEWAKAHRINDARGGSLNSYSLTLLVVFHLQTCEPPILPPLREIYPGNMAEELTGLRVNAERQIEEICLHNMNRYKNDTRRRINRSFLAEIFFSFIRKFCNITDRALLQGVSPYNGQWEDIETNMRWLPKTYAFFIEDPFEQPSNSARTVTGKELENISEAFQTTYNALMTPQLDRLSLLSVLVAPHISQLTRVPFAGGSHQNNITRPLPNWPPATPPALHTRRSNGSVAVYNNWQGPNRRADVTQINRGTSTDYHWRGPNNERRPDRGRGRGRGTRQGAENGYYGSTRAEIDARPPGESSSNQENDGPPNGSRGPNAPVQARRNQVWKEKSDGQENI